jgi:hypothetical protein
MVQLQQLCFLRSAWPSVSKCLTIRGSSDKPHDAVVPIPAEHGMSTLIVGGTIIFNKREWEAVCTQLGKKTCIILTPVQA